MANILEMIADALGMNNSKPTTATSGFGAGTTQSGPQAAVSATSSGVLARKQRYDKYVIEQQSAGQTPVPIEDFAALEGGQ